MDQLPEIQNTSNPLSFRNVLITLVIILVLGNLGYLDWKALTERDSVKGNAIQAPTDASQLQTTCSDSCLLAIREATGSIKPGETKTIVEKQTTPTQSIPSAQEIYIPLGSGTTANRDWTDIKSAEAYIDTSKYSGNISVSWEAFLYNYTGNGATFARLYNVTDKTNVWFSELTIDGANSSIRVASGKINLAAGNKLYRVQLYTNTGYEARIDNARVKIVTGN